jgi:hypothetical protein
MLGTLHTVKFLFAIVQIGRNLGSVTNPGTVKVGKSLVFRWYAKRA